MKKRIPISRSISEWQPFHGITRAFFLASKSVRIEFLRIWIVFRIKMNGMYGDDNVGAFFDYNIRSGHAIIIFRSTRHKWTTSILSQCFLKKKNIKNDYSSFKQ